MNGPLVIALLCGAALVGLHDVDMLIGGVLGLVIFLPFAWWYHRPRKPRFLRTTLYDSFYMKGKAPAPLVRPWLSLVCGHSSSHEFCRTDTREGPGWMSDSYEGRVCAQCGRILTERKVY